MIVSLSILFITLNLLTGLNVWGLLIDDLPTKRDELKEGFTQSEKDLILYLHNAYRSVVQPRATEMNELLWDAGLERKAQSWANQCTGNHNPDTSYNYVGYNGENMALYIQSKYSEAAAVKAWFNESKVFTYSPLRCKGETDLSPCAHYITMVWAKFQTVGCGIKRCPELSGIINEFPEAKGRKAYLIVCNYAGANFISNRAPYVEGVPCAGCPGGLNPYDPNAVSNARCRNNLCTSIAMIQSGAGYNGSLALLDMTRNESGVTQATDNTVPARCSGVVCQNGGNCVESHKNFTCVCPSGFDGEFCQTKLQEYCEGKSVLCVENAYCDSLDRCQCRHGYHGSGRISCTTPDRQTCISSGDSHVKTFGGVNLRFPVPCRALLTDFKKLIAHSSIKCAVKVFGKASMSNGNLLNDAVHVYLSVLNDKYYNFEVYLDEKRQLFYYKKGSQIIRRKFDRTVDRTEKVGPVTLHIYFDNSAAEQMYVMDLGECETKIKFKGYNGVSGQTVPSQTGIAIITKDVIVNRPGTLCWEKTSNEEMLSQEQNENNLSSLDSLALYHYLFNPRNNGEVRSYCSLSQKAFQSCPLYNNRSPVLNQCFNITQKNSLQYAEEANINIMKKFYQCISGYCRGREILKRRAQTYLKKVENWNN